MIQAGVITKTVDESKKALNRIAAKNRRVLIRTGGYGRKTMRRTIPRRKSKAQPGAPPHAHAKGNAALKDVRFSVNDRDESVLIGHIRYPRKGTKDKHGVRRLVTSPKPFPQLMNEGGSASLRVSSPKKGDRKYPMNYRPHPFRDKAQSPTEDFMLSILDKENL